MNLGDLKQTEIKIGTLENVPVSDDQIFNQEEIDNFIGLAHILKKVDFRLKMEEENLSS